jgi:hypothetical protein
VIVVVAVGTHVSSSKACCNWVGAALHKCGDCVGSSSTDCRFKGWRAVQLGWYASSRCSFVLIRSFIG